MSRLTRNAVTQCIPSEFMFWNLHMLQASQNAQDVGVTGQGSAAPEVKQVAVSC